MKNLEKLQKSYDSQKKIYNEARERRILNRQKEIGRIEQKILSLQTQRELLRAANQNEKEFESFDSFRSRSEQQAKQSTEASET